MQAGGRVAVLARVAEGGERAGLGQDAPVGIVGRRARYAARAVGQSADAAQLVTVSFIQLEKCGAQNKYSVLFQYLRQIGPQSGCNPVRGSDPPPVVPAN